jgi:hypothetical protein
MKKDKLGSSHRGSTTFDRLRYCARLQNPLPSWSRYVLLWPIFLAALLSPIFYEFPNWPISYVLTFDSQDNAASHTFGAFCWEFKNNFVNVPIMRAAYLRASINVPGGGMRIRTLHYLVAAKIVNPTVFFKSRGNHQIKKALVLEDDNQWNKLETLPLIEGPNSVEQQVKLALAEYLLAFHNNPPKNLSWLWFDDPFDFVQQSMFKTCVERALNPELAKAGLRVELIQFNLE